MVKLRLTTLVVGLTLCSATAAQAPSRPMGDFSSIYDGIEWRSQCIKPAFFGSTSEDRRRASLEYSTYVDCVKRRADSDAEYASAEVYRQATREVRSVRTDAEFFGLRF